MRSAPPAGPGGRMVKSSKPSSDSWFTSSTVLTTLYSNGISAPKHRASSRQLAENSNASRRADDRGPGHAKEQSVLDDARDGVEGSSECSIDGPKGGVEHEVAVVRLEQAAAGHTELGPPAEGLDRTAGRLPEEWQGFDGDRGGPPARD